MRTLAIDTSSKAASCAVWEDGTLRGEYFLNAGLTHSQTIMPMMEALCAHIGLGLGDIDRFAVSVGPGSFTGLRIGISAVKGMAVGVGKPCVGVSTLRALAQNIAHFSGLVVPVMDARRGQVYTALLRSDGAAVTRLVDDCAIPIAELGDKLRAYAPEPVMLVGDGAELCFAALEGVENLHLCSENLRHQRAACVAQVADAEGQAVDAAVLEPVYLRLPQAERELRKKQEAER